MSSSVDPVLVFTQAELGRVRRYRDSTNFLRVSLLLWIQFSSLAQGFLLQNLRQAEKVDEKGE